LRHAFAQVKPVSQVAKGTIRTFNVPKSTLATSTTQPAAEQWPANKPTASLSVLTDVRDSAAVPNAPNERHRNQRQRTLRVRVRAKRA
jgi:hypothetical protein